MTPGPPGGRPRRGPWGWFFSLIVAGAAQPAPANASADRDSALGAETPQSPTALKAGPLSHVRVLAYPIAQVWPTAVRYLRVDREFTIVDRDPEAGYILFDFPLGSSDLTGRGSIEMFVVEDNSRAKAVRVQISTDAGPLHLPHALADGIAKKLRIERGQPSLPAPTPAPPPQTDPDPPAGQSLAVAP